MKDRDQVEVLTQWLRPFHGYKQRNLSRALRGLDLGKSSTKLESRGRCDFRLEQSDLIKHDPQRLLTQMLVLDVDGDAEQADVTRLEFWQKIRGDDVPARPAQEETERQIVMKIYQP